MYVSLSIERCEDTSRPSVLLALNNMVYIIAEMCKCIYIYIYTIEKGACPGMVPWGTPLSEAAAAEHLCIVWEETFYFLVEIYTLLALLSPISTKGILMLQLYF